jgi:hypothetical protein
MALASRNRTTRSLSVINFSARSRCIILPCAGVSSVRSGISVKLFSSQ